MNSWDYFEPLKNYLYVAPPLLTSLDAFEQTAGEQKQILRTLVERNICEDHFDVRTNLDDSISRILNWEKTFFTSDALNRRVGGVDCN